MSKSKKEKEPEWELPDSELKKLDKLAHIIIIYLLFIALATFFVGAYFLALPDTNVFLSISLIGITGSTVAALTSCLDRYSTGFEREIGEPYPPDIEKGKGKFNRRFSRWLLIRPYLGAIVAPVFIWGISIFIDKPEVYLGNKLGFTAFMAGLLAKSVLDLIKNLFKNVFRS